MTKNRLIVGAYLVVVLGGLAWLGFGAPRYITRPKLASGATVTVPASAGSMWLGGVAVAAVLIVGLLIARAVRRR